MNSRNIVHMSTRSRAHKKLSKKKPSPLQVTLAAKLRNCIQDGESIRSFSKRLGKTESTVSGWLNEKVLPRASDLVAIATTLRVTIDWIVGIPEAPKHATQWRAEPEFEKDVGAAVRDRLARRSQTWAEVVQLFEFNGSRAIEVAAQIARREIMQTALYSRAHAPVRDALGFIEARRPGIMADASKTERELHQARDAEKRGPLGDLLPVAVAALVEAMEAANAFRLDKEVGRRIAVDPVERAMDVAWKRIRAASDGRLSASEQELRAVKHAESEISTAVSRMPVRTRELAGLYEQLTREDEFRRESANARRDAKLRREVTQRLPDKSSSRKKQKPRN